MEEAVNGIRDTFYRDLAAGYQREGERSFLYKYFWRESARELLERVSSEPPEGSLTPKDLRERLCKALGERPDLGRGLLLQKPPGEGRRERRDFWQELMLNDAGYRAGVITDREYYIWLTAYLAARDIYYKDSGPWGADGVAWLRPLLRSGLGDNLGDNSKAGTERDLKALARLLGDENTAMEAAGRLHGLRQRVVRGGRARKVDYLPWLTARLESAALHSKIKTWLQDGGYPLRAEGVETGAPRTPRKQDFSLRLFDAYCASPGGYGFIPKSLSGWQMSGKGFCLLDGREIDALLRALNGRDADGDTAYLYIPLAVHMPSGCVLFLAGKAVYEYVYDREVPAKRDAYRNVSVPFGFDFLRLNRAFWEALGPEAAAGPFRLGPTFHENAGRSYGAVLNDFKRYCVVGVKSAAETVQRFNQDAPAGTPAPFLWAFCSPETPEEPGPSADGREAFSRARGGAPGGPVGSLV